MRKCTRLPLLVFSLVTFFTSLSAAGQTMLQPEPAREIEMTARHSVEEWDKQLGLRAKQAVLMEKKFIEYALRRNEVLRSNLPEEVKRKQLATLNFMEVPDMRNILTKPQYDWYVYLLSLDNSEKGLAENR